MSVESHASGRERERERDGGGKSRLPHGSIAKGRGKGEDAALRRERQKPPKLS